MHRSIFLIFLLFQGITVFATHKKQSDSLLLVLDKTIKEKSLYAEKKECRIDSLKILLNEEATLEERFHIYQKLYTEYIHYNMSSALSVADKELIIAKELQNQQYIYIAEMNAAEILGKMGKYKESLDIIDNIHRWNLDKQQWSYYFHLYHSLYSLMYENALSQQEKSYYNELISQYKDSILQVLEINGYDYNLVKNGKLMEQGRYDEALFLLNQCYKKYGSDESLLGTLAYSLSDVYAKKGDSEHEKQYLAISATADLKRAVKSHIALRKLAILLYKEGDINLAYNYIKCSMEDAAFCGARFRIMEISETLPIINAAYDKKVEQEKETLFRYSMLISALSFVLVISLLFIWRQFKKLLFAKESIKSMYEDMRLMNDNLDELNKKLSESNHVKEEYIGSIFNLCSTYINKMESYRINLNRNLIASRIEEARKMTRSTLIPDELKEFFGYFDAIFLNIYPNFIDEFNALLADEAKIIPKTGDILTPELRVFALIRLGITNSSKIASFLHYSPQTVYNYKLKIRNKLLVSKEDFSVAMQQIGK
jgi:tetratricopeptide (TPR) repeat protein